MTENLDISATGLIRRMVKDITSRPIAVGTVLTGLGSILTFCVLFTYLHAIGYPVLLGAALGTTTALIPWIVIATLTLALYFAGLMATSAFYASALAFFNRTPGIQPYMAIMLVLPALAGITTMVTSIILGQHRSAFFALSTSGITVTAALLAMLLIPRFKAAIDGCARQEGDSVPATEATWVAKFVGLAGAIWGSAISAMFPMFLLINSYPWPTDRFGLYRFAGICIVTAVLGLLPAAAFYIWKDKQTTRTRHTIGGMVLAISGALFFAPATIPMVVDSAASMIGIKDLQVASYMVKDTTYAVEDFDSQWGKPQALRGFPVVEAFALFRLGDLLLLCPQSLSGTKLVEWPSLSKACLVLDAKLIKRMPMKVDQD